MRTGRIIASVCPTCFSRATWTFPRQQRMYMSIHSRHPFERMQVNINVLDVIILFVQTYGTYKVRKGCFLCVYICQLRLLICKVTSLCHFLSNCGYCGTLCSQVSHFTSCHLVSLGVTLCYLYSNSVTWCNIVSRCVTLQLCFTHCVRLVCGHCCTLCHLV